MSKLETMQWVAYVSRRRNRYLDPDGYVHIKVPGHNKAAKQGYAREHIVVFERVHKCCMLKWGDVHHIDGNKQNNDWINLQGLSHGQHSSLTNKEDISGITCLRCGRDTRRVMSKGRRHPHLQRYEYENGHICRSCYEMLRYYKKKGLNLAGFLSSSKIKAKSAPVSS